MKRQSQIPLLSIRNATFRLGDRLVFENTDWTIVRGEPWAIVGENGSGKSLLGDALRGRLPLVGGELDYHFRPPPGFSPEQCIGHVSFDQRKAQSGQWIVQSRWNSAEHANALKVSEYLSCESVLEINPFEIRDAIDAGPFLRRRKKVLKVLGISGFLERALLSLSNGERQKVELARALCLPLRFLILDDPFSGLDDVSREHLHGILSRLISSGLNLVLIAASASEIPGEVTRVAEVRDCQVAGFANRHSARLLRPGRPSRWQPAQPPVRAHHRSTAAPSTSGETLVEMRNVVVRYGKRTILNDISWEVRANESWALLGPNGSGKTTLLSLIMGDNPQAYSNHVVVFGRQRGTGESIWEIKRSVGWVSPELHTHFQDHTSCIEAVESGFYDSIGLFEPVTLKQRRLAREWLDRLELLDSADQPFFSISTGLQRMVLLARALVKSPKLLILDEPCQGLDPHHRALFLNTLSALLRSRKETAIYVTHQPHEIVPEITMVLRLNAGRERASRSADGNVQCR